MKNYRHSQFTRGISFHEVSQEFSQNKVLRNTYWLLAISLIPSIFGVLFGMLSGIHTSMLANPGLSAIIFFFGSFGLMLAVEKNKNNSLGVVFLLFFTFFMGVMLSRLLGIVLGMSNGSQLVLLAFSGTAAVFTTMATLAGVIKKDLSDFQKWLSIGLVIILIASLANMFIKMNAMILTISLVATFIFSAFILVDLQKIIRGGEDNYISATLMVYLDIYNVFTNMLVLLASLFGGTNRE